MNIIDLTHTINSEMMVFPGDEKPQIIRRTSFENDGFLESSLKISSHAGTHMDSAYHIFEDGVSLDKMEIENFVGKAILIDVKNKEEGSFITMDDLSFYLDRIEMVDFVVFNTGWHHKWNDESYLRSYPIMDEEVIKFMNNLSLKGIGVDTISIDSSFENYLARHKIFLKKKDFVIIENLNNLDLIESELFTLFALPLKWEDADGAPIRAIAITE